MDKQVEEHLHGEIDKAFDRLRPIGLGDLIARSMRESLEGIIEGAMGPYMPILNEYETLEEIGEEE